MLKKFIISLLITTAMVCGNSVQAITETTKILPAFSSISNEQNRLWVGTFQLVWNDFMDEIIKSPIKFKNYDSEDANDLNKQEFKKSMISEQSYVGVFGETNLELKSLIEQELMDKFQEESELLKQIDWTDKFNAYLFFVMLKKDFDFITKFEKLNNEKFTRNKGLIPYFGLDKKSPAYLYNTVDVLFYNNPFDYAVSIKGNDDQVILYRTNQNKSFSAYYEDIKRKSGKYKGNKKFVAGDRLKVPYMSLKLQTGFDDLCNKQIENTNLYIDKALQSVDFNLNRKGVKLKSEAIIDVNTMSFHPDPAKVRGRNLYFNNTFVLFLKETNKNVPYMGIRVKDMSYYKYTKEVD